MKKSCVAAGVALALFVAGCVSFIMKPDEDLLKEKEQKVYVLAKSVSVGEKTLKKGEEVKILISRTNDWIKVHAYPARADLLKTDRFLVLYIFNDEFKDKQFDMKYFEERLAAVVVPKGTPLPDDRGAASKDKKIKKKK